MDISQYFALATDALDKLEELQRQREAIDADAMKLEQFVTATANMLPDDAKDVVLRRMSSMQELFRVREFGLTEAARIALKSRTGQWLTASNVRDQLLALGFDFSTYTTNPLASVSTVLRRMKQEEVEITTVDGGVVAYRWKQPSQAEKAEAIAKLRGASRLAPP